MEMKKVLIVFIMFFATIVFIGCGDESNYVLPEENTDEVTDTDRGIDDEVDEDLIYFPCQGKYDFESVAVTVVLYDEDGMISYEPGKVANRIYEHSLSAIDQCFDYETVFLHYRNSMTMLNACDNTRYTPEMISEYFFEAMLETINYDPYNICPGGCGTVKRKYGGVI